MKRFEFTLQKLYDVKYSAEKRKRAQLKDLNRNLETYSKQLAACQVVFKKQHGEYRKKCTNGLGMLEVKQYGDYLQYLEKEMRRQKNIIASCQKSIGECRGQLLTLINEQHVLERMREEQYHAYQKEVQKSDDRMIEDFMQARY